MKIVILGSGSKGNSTLVEINGKVILIDVGFSFKAITEKMKEANYYPKDIDYVFITHDHSDHMYGLKTLLNKLSVNVYVDSKIINAYDFLKDNYKVISLSDEQMLEGNILVKSIPTSHDSISSYGFLIETNEDSMVLITDTGYINERNIVYLKNKKYYLIESNHNVEMLRNGRYPIKTQQRILSPTGHLSNEYSAAYMTKMLGTDTKKIVLCHISEENNNEEIALETYKKIFKENDIKFKNIECAKQREVMEIK